MQGRWASISNLWRNAVIKLAAALVTAIAIVALSGCVEEQEPSLSAETAQEVVRDYADRCLRLVRAEDNPTFFRREFAYFATFDGFVKTGAPAPEERWTVTGPGLDASKGSPAIAPGKWRVVAGQKNPVPLDDAASLYNRTIVRLAYGDSSRPSGCS